MSRILESGEGIKSKEKEKDIVTREANDHLFSSPDEAIEQLPFSREI